MCDREHILDRFDIDCESSFDSDEYLQCLGESGYEIMNYQKLTWIKNELFLEKSEMI